MTQFPDPATVQRICCIGGGPIGGGWTAFFLSRGYQVTSYLHDPAEEDSLRELIDIAWPSLQALGLADGASLDKLRCSSELADAITGAQFIQESAPEAIELKQALYAQLGKLVPDHVVIASSTSGLPMSDIQAQCSTPGRTVVGHPFNPPYLLPLVEVVGGSQTDPSAVQWVVEFYRRAGKAPLVMAKEIPGFIATRLQEAIWREALHMIKNGEATVEDIDFAIVNGPGPRWAFMGPCLTYHLGGGEGGMAYCLDHFGPSLKLPWSRLDAPELTDALRQRLVEGSAHEVGDRDYAALRRQRDAGLVGIHRLTRQLAGESDSGGD
jgi:carnitine 3-dehydrogenase